MDYRIFKNSYVIFVISFIVLCLLFYIFKWGYKTVIINGEPVKKFSWNYPLAISLVIWLVWHFYLYPPHDLIEGTSALPSKQVGGVEAMARPKASLNDQIINMNNWS